MTQSLDWQTESLRFTFLGCPDTSANLITWSAITGRDADSITTKKALGTRNEEGVWEGSHLVVAVQQGRIDVTMSPAAPEVNLAAPEFPSMGSLVCVADRLRDSLVKMRFPKSARLAVGAKVNSFTQSSSDTLEMMKKSLPFLDVEKTCIDVVFQQNKPKKMRPSGIEINRICKWTQLTMHFLQFMPAEGQIITNDNSAEVKYALQLDLDLNTAMTAQLPHQDSYGKIVEGLFAELKNTLAEVS
ncbi:hypothetical protein [Pseudomonas mandelii]|uniref:hypothetical protein n=1 Tax=Pseudomonas mandelii TaxID=75612 RepID=UPI00224B717D|nr:hypothetical protein [Pseudomonas mandelii]MCX2896827.1 hypothetical protein [Pseudomonas mandelii]